MVIDKRLHVRKGWGLCIGVAKGTYCYLVLQFVYGTFYIRLPFKKTDDYAVNNYGIRINLKGLFIDWGLHTYQMGSPFKKIS